jgi:hypothetical protein
MAIQRMRFQVRLDPHEGRQVVRWAEAEGRSFSSAVAHLVMRGLEQETGSGVEQLRRMCDAMTQQLEQVQEVMEVLETREAERFRRFLGHLQHHQALTTELVCGQRVKMAGDRPRDYEKTIQSARGQVTEDAVVFRESIALVGPVRRSDNATKSPGRVP